MFAKLTAIAALFTLAAPVARGAVHNVTVGGTGILKYDPEFINADPGDEIIFTFKQKNHTVTQSSLNSPCVALQDGFDSGFVPVADDMTDNFPVAQYQVKDTNPVWVYCRQTGHCQQGMVFAVNPGDNLAAFQANAVGGASGTSSVAASTAAATTSAAQGAPSVVTVTATVTVNGQTETTTYGSYPGSAAPTAVASQDHLIVVGDNNTLTFSPNNISAQVGDTITFKFSTKNHTATQSSFADPCSPLSAASTSGQVGFDSGFMPAAGAATPPTFTVTVNDTAPIWVYCKQTNPASHCAAGMVFSANAIESGPNNFGAFQAKAKASGGTSPSASGSSSSAAPSSTDANNGAARIGESGWGAGVLVAALAALAGSLVL